MLVSSRHNYSYVQLFKSWPWEKLGCLHAGCCELYATDSGYSKPLWVTLGYVSRGLDLWGTVTSNVSLLWATLKIHGGVSLVEQATPPLIYLHSKRESSESFCVIIHFGAFSTCQVYYMELLVRFCPQTTTRWNAESINWIIVIELPSPLLPLYPSSSGILLLNVFFY